MRPLRKVGDRKLLLLLLLVERWRSGAAEWRR